MMSAKEAFKELGYLIEVDNKDLIKYSKEDCGHITFYFDIETKRFYSGYRFSSCCQSTPHCITLDEFEAVRKQMEELGWIAKEEKAETNYEHFKDEIVQKVKYNLAVVNGEPKPCEDTNCDECDFKCSCCGEKRFEWLASPYKKPTYKLSKFEYDLLSVHKDYKTYNNIANQIHLFKMREKGYFKDVDTNIPIREILDNCEVIKR